MMANRPLNPEIKKARVAEMWRLAEKQGGVISFGQYREIAKDNGDTNRSRKRYEGCEMPDIIDGREMADRRRAYQAWKAASNGNSEPTVLMSVLFKLWGIASKDQMYLIIDRITGRYKLPFPIVFDDKSGCKNHFKVDAAEIDFTPRDQHTHPEGFLCTEPRRWIDWEINKETGECWIAMVM